MSKADLARPTRSRRLPEAMGRAADGVVILRPVARSKHFTREQIEKIIDGIKAPRPATDKAK